MKNMIYTLISVSLISLSALAFNAEDRNLSLENDQSKSAAQAAVVGVDCEICRQNASNSGLFAKKEYLGLLPEGSEAPGTGTEAKGKGVDGN